MALKIPYSRVDWINTIFLLAISLLALVAAPIHLFRHGLDWFIGGLFAFYVIATGMSITLGYHRLFSHLSFKAKWPVRLFTLVFGACAFENSALNWASDHRRHHKHTDHDDDPYNIQQGFLWAHIGWILFKVLPEPPLDNVADLRRDRLVMLQHRTDKLIAVGVGLILPAALGYWWNGTEGALAGFLIVGALRVFVVQQCTFFINSLCHTIGRQPYSSTCSARDSTLMAFLTFGEGYHNFHHRFQHDYRNGVKAWAFDPTKWATWCLAKVGLVSGLRRVPEHQILLAEMDEARKHVGRQLADIHQSGTSVCDNALQAVHALEETLALAYHELGEAIDRKAEISRRTLARWRRQTRELVERVSALAPTPT
ncbi:stearoyl-CoA desaturase (delta-9 desaturase) [Haloferula luteola]|uniref:Stearoyl-CoA desaturase (Delta-9 desaturase) n=1 Tax=Haloferula luteola TaxID=595692 RepID=A0A840UYV0_9BACT|nr:fatty acid desaturase [Haloferula luteola]MBB5350183.1 stearoyl-CoA desaturase (delta-9 desaturase) [Haloferula luteola]